MLAVRRDPTTASLRVSLDGAPVRQAGPRLMACVCGRLVRLQDCSDPRRSPTAYTSPMMSDSELKKLLAVVRLGDADRLGWWRSHSLDETAEYVLGESLPTTWMATGIELAMESARLRHESALERPTALHLFSDYLPFHHLLKSWLIDRKLGRDLAPLEWLRNASTPELVSILAGDVRGELRASGLHLGEITRADLETAAAPTRLLALLTPAYTMQSKEFAAPYLDLVG